MLPTTRVLLTTLAVALLLASGLAHALKAQEESARGGEPGHVLARMHMMNQKVIQASELAAERGQHEDVLDYAARLRKDHSFADKKVLALARQLGIDLDPILTDLRQKVRSSEPGDGGESETTQGAGDQQEGAEPTPIRAMKQLSEKVRHLEQLHGLAFDRDFVDAMGQAHRRSVKDLSEVRSQTDSNPLEELLSDLVPILRQHVDLARTLQRKLGGVS